MARASGARIRRSSGGRSPVVRSVGPGGPASRASARDRRSTAARAGMVIAAASAMRGRMPRKIQRQPSVSATRPASAGPISPGMTHAVERTANMRGRSASGSTRPIATYATGGSNPAPMPCRTRARTSSGIEGARPPSARPAAKQASPNARGGASPEPRSTSPPEMTMPTMVARKKAEKTHPYSSRPPRSRATSGITVPTASDSEATSVTVSTRPADRARRSGDQSPALTSRRTSAPRRARGARCCRGGRARPAREPRWRTRGAAGAGPSPGSAR